MCVTIILQFDNEVIPIDKVININKFKEEAKKTVEDKAYDLYGIIKTKEDLYIYPECSFTTGAADLEYLFVEELRMSVEDLLEKEAIDEINDLVPMKGQKVTIMLIKEEENDLLTFDIFNMSTNKNILIATPMSFTEENRRIFTGIIAKAIKKIDVNVTFYLRLTYAEVEELVK